MKFPEYTDTPRNLTIVDSLIDDIADLEMDTVTYYPELEDPYSKRLGQACLEAAGSDYHIAYAPFACPPDATHDQQVYECLYGLVLSRDGDTRYQTHYQQQLHGAVVGNLQTCLQGKTTDERGRRAEYVGLGLLTRYAHPQMLSYPSLSHHEIDTDTAGHYDIGVICATDENRGEVYHLQVKSECFGTCHNSKNTRYLDRLQPKYRPINQLISGCCDLEICGDRAHQQEVPRLLVKEYEEALAPAEVKRLDSLSDSLLWKASNDLLPRGIHQGNSIAINPAVFQSYL